MSEQELFVAVESWVAAQDDRVQALNRLRERLHGLSPQQSQPVDFVKWVPIEKVVANDYNPNSVAREEMRLLFISIHHDGYTQPCVTIYDEERDLYVIVDGFHRYYTAKTNPEILERCCGLLPVVVLAKSITDRMASTVRHNRARGKHSTAGMSNMVFHMLDNGMADAEICHELGMSADELMRLKHITGFSKLFEDHEYRKAWMSAKQIMIHNKVTGKKSVEFANQAKE